MLDENSQGEQIASTALAARLCLASAVRCYFEAVEVWEPAPLWEVLFGGGAAFSADEAALPAALVRRGSRHSRGSGVSRPAAAMPSTHHHCAPRRLRAHSSLQLACWAICYRQSGHPLDAALRRCAMAMCACALSSRQQTAFNTPPPRMQAPPTDRKYRATLAKAIEACTQGFQQLVVAAVATESRLLRAAVVRVMARAAGGWWCLRGRVQCQEPRGRALITGPRWGDHRLGRRHGHVFDAALDERAARRQVARGRPGCSALHSMAWDHSPPPAHLPLSGFAALQSRHHPCQCAMRSGCSRCSYHWCTARR